MDPRTTKKRLGSFLLVRRLLRDVQFNRTVVKAVAVVLADATDHDGTCFLSETTIASRVGCEEKTVRRALADLERQRIVFVKRPEVPGRGRVNHYTFADWLREVENRSLRPLSDMEKGVDRSSESATKASQKGGAMPDEEGVKREISKRGALAAQLGAAVRRPSWVTGVLKTYAGTRHCRVVTDIISQALTAHPNDQTAQLQAATAALKEKGLAYEPQR